MKSKEWGGRRGELGGKTERKEQMREKEGRGGEAKRGERRKKEGREK